MVPHREDRDDGGGEPLPQAPPAPRTQRGWACGKPVVSKSASATAGTTGSEARAPPVAAASVAGLSSGSIRRSIRPGAQFGDRGEMELGRALRGDRHLFADGA